MIGMTDTLDKVLDVFRGCKYFEITNDGYQEYYYCRNYNRWGSLGYTDEELEEDYEDNIKLIAVARYTADGELIDFTIEDFDFDFSGCKYKEVEKIEHDR